MWGSKKNEGLNFIPSRTILIDLVPTHPGTIIMDDSKPYQLKRIADALERIERLIKEQKPI